jgi:predicted dehydrogenase
VRIVAMNKIRVVARKLLLTAATAPLIISSRAWGANNRIRVGQIGCGRIAQGHDMPGVIKSELADYVAICELDQKRLADGVKIIEKSYTDRGMAPPQIRTFDNYRELIARKDIDAVVISTPDHWHAEVALAAIESGKDVYLQKPFTMTHAEGVILRDAVKRHGRILQVGSQQRSWEQFRRAAELIPLRSHRQRAARGDRPADRPDRAGRAAQGIRPTSTSASG